MVNLFERNHSKWDRRKGPSETSTSSTRFSSVFPTSIGHHLAVNSSAFEIRGLSQPRTLFVIHLLAIRRYFVSPFRDTHAAMTSPLEKPPRSCFNNLNVHPGFVFQLQSRSDNLQLKIQCFFRRQEWDSAPMMFLGRYSYDIGQIATRRIFPLKLQPSTYCVGSWLLENRLISNEA